MAATLTRRPRPRWHPSPTRRDRELRATVRDWDKAFAIIGAASQSRQPPLSLVPPLESAR